MKLKFFGYFIFIAVCIIYSLVAHFPSKTVSKYIEQNFSQINSQVKLQIDNIYPSFPPGIKADSILVSYAGAPIARFDNFKSFFDLTSVFSDTLTGSFKTGVFDGIMSGIVRVSKDKTWEAGIETELKNLNFKNFQMGKDLPGYQFSGILNGKVTTGLNKQGQILKNYGEVNFTDFSLQFPEALFALEKYSFLTGKVKFTMHRQNIIKIEKCNMKGRQLDIQAHGEIRLAAIFQKSILNIKARAILYPMFFMNAGNSKPADIAKNDSGNVIINLQIKGTIQNPKIKLGQGTK
ncbi:MAG: type II secretion system protein GspN [Deltaproteobacteria bacterium]|nr:MAG: type II secretion system protein GspN [Deltaproteobacteria bacterium]